MQDFEVISNKYHKNIKLGNIALPSNVILAPMSGVTDLPFRRIVRSFGDELLVTEMVASQAIVMQSKKTLRRAAMESGMNEKKMHPISVQIVGYQPEIMAEAARINEDLGADIIDINFGCPVKKVVNTLSGSSLMRDEKLATEIMEAVFKATKLPVTVKMRMGWDHDNLNAPKLAKIAEDIGFSMVAIHGRTRNQLYTGKADWGFIRNVREAIKIPLLVNGDICSFADAKMAMDLSGADGIMVGRACYGRPWFINQLTEYFKTGVIPEEISQERKWDTIKKHIEYIKDTYSERELRSFTIKHLGWYSAGMRFSGEFRRNIFQSNDIEYIIQQAELYFNSPEYLEKESPKEGDYPDNIDLSSQI